MIDEGILVGVLGGARGASVTRTGRLIGERTAWDLDWWIGGDDRWHVPGREVAVRQSRVEDMPVVQTSMRVPGGDAVQRVFGAAVAGADDVAVIDVANESPAPFVAALVVRGASTVDLDRDTVYVDGRAALRTARPPSRWAVGGDGTTEDTVTGGNASDGPFTPRRDRGARLTAAFLYPVAHRTTLRAAITLGLRGLGTVDVKALPGPDAVARGWRAQLDRGMRVELPDPVLQTAVDTARAATLLAGQAWKADPAVVATLEDWGFDAEAAGAWTRLTGRERRRLGNRVPTPATWAAVRELAASGNRALLAAVRSSLLRDEDASIVLLDEWPSEWRGLAVDVRDAPTRRGPVSFSVRWHGDRPALLWDAPADVRLTVPGLDPNWSTTEPHGEALLSPP